MYNSIGPTFRHIIDLIWEKIGKNVKPKKTAYPTEVRLLYKNNDTSGKAIVLVPGKDKCIITVYDYDKTTKTPIYEGTVDNAIFERIVNIAKKYKFETMNKIAYSNEAGRRWFSISYGKHFQYFVSNYQEHDIRVYTMLDEIEDVLKEYI